METRLARLEDAEAIRQIYNLEVSTSTVTFDLVPRTLHDQITWLQARSGAHVVIVADDADDVVGFASLSPFRDRPAYNSTVESSVYVRSDQRGRGVGQRPRRVPNVGHCPKAREQKQYVQRAGAQDAAEHSHRQIATRVAGFTSEYGCRLEPHAGKERDEDSAAQCVEARRPR